MNDLRSPALQFAIDGEELEVLRSWPGARGTRIFECRDERGRVRAAQLVRGGRLSVLPYASDRRLASLRPGGELIVHRAGRRAVERTENGYIKHLRSGRAAGAAKATAAVGRMAAHAGFSVPRVLASDEHSVSLSAVPGAALLDLTEEDWERAWARWSVWWPQLIQQSLDTAEHASSALHLSSALHDAAVEAEVVGTWFEHLRAFDAGGFGTRLHAGLTDLESRVCAQLRALSNAQGRRPVIAHRDLHDGQMLFCAVSGSLGLLDFDTAVHADRELDLGNLDAHISLRLAQGLIDEARAEVAHAAVRRAAAAVDADPERLQAYRGAAQARLVCVYAFRPQWSQLAAHLAGELI